MMVTRGGKQYPRVATLHVLIELDPDAYVEEYGVTMDSDTMTEAAETVRDALAMRFGPLNFGITTYPGFEENNEWCRVTFGDPEVLPVHRDALAPGQRNPYDPKTGEFIAKCVCGAEFRSDGDPFSADSLMMDHCEVENAK